MTKKELKNLEKLLIMGAKIKASNQYQEKLDELMPKWYLKTVDEIKRNYEIGEIYLNWRKLIKAKI
jgi:hypothetical protein